MKIWIDGDGCPKTIKEILFRAAIKRQVMVIIVTNHAIAVPHSPFIKKIQVGAGFDKADDYIVEQAGPGNLIITSDIILADKVIEKRALALNPRGNLYTSNNIKGILTLRHVNESLRESGLVRGGLDSLSAKEIQSFSNHLDKMITAFKSLAQ